MNEYKKKKLSNTNLSFLILKYLFTWYKKIAWKIYFVC